MKKVLTALATASVAAALAACGGDDDEGPTKEEFVNQANGICADGDKRVEQALEGTFENPNDPKPEEAQAAIAEVLPIGRDIQMRLEDLERPEGDEDEIQRYIDAFDRSMDALAAAGRDPRASLEYLENAEQPGSPEQQADDAANAYGLTACAD